MCPLRQVASNPLVSLSEVLSRSRGIRSCGKIPDQGRASRGFHFQEAVGAWLASRIAAGELIADRLTPEGFDDLQLEGGEPIQFEVKSRQERRGPFLN